MLTVIGFQCFHYVNFNDVVALGKNKTMAYQIRCFSTKHSQTWLVISVYQTTGTAISQDTVLKQLCTSRFGTTPVSAEQPYIFSTKSLVQSVLSILSYREIKTKLRDEMQENSR